MAVDLRPVTSHSVGEASRSAVSVGGRQPGPSVCGQGTGRRWYGLGRQALLLGQMPAAVHRLDRSGVWLSVAGLQAL